MSINKGRAAIAAPITLPTAPWERPQGVSQPAVVVPITHRSDMAILRERVLGALADGPLSTEEIRAIVDPEARRGRAALYNAVYYLSRIGLVRKIPAEGGRPDRWALTGMAR